MGVGAGLYMYNVVVKKFTFAISSPDEFLYFFEYISLKSTDHATLCSAVYSVALRLWVCVPQV